MIRAGAWRRVAPAAFAATSSALLTVASARELDPEGALAEKRLAGYRRVAEEWQDAWDKMLSRGR